MTIFYIENTHCTQSRISYIAQSLGLQYEWLQSTLRSSPPVSTHGYITNLMQITITGLDGWCQLDRLATTDPRTLGVLSSYAVLCSSRRSTEHRKVPYAISFIKQYTAPRLGIYTDIQRSCCIVYWPWEIRRYRIKTGSAMDALSTLVALSPSRRIWRKQLISTVGTLSDGHAEYKNSIEASSKEPVNITSESRHTGG